MDGNRFDNISRAFAGRSTRRAAIRQAGAGGMLAAVAGAIGMGRNSAFAQDDDTTEPTPCKLVFYAETAVGPDKNDIYEGEIDFEINADGAIDTGVLTTKDGDEYDFVGQAVGRAINLRITIENGKYLSLTGTGQTDIDLCRGGIDGTFGGPKQRDLGTWYAARKARGNGEATATATTGSGGDQGGGGTDEPTPTRTPCPEIDCGTTFVLNPDTCECGCPPPYDQCGDSTCCFGGAVCNSDGSCQCPDGTEPCNEVCTPSCPSGQVFDDSCQCITITSCGAGETLCNGVCVSLECPPNRKFDPASCQCINPCPSGQDFCSNQCIDIINDENNCGTCGNVCPPNMPCIAGTCKCPGGQNYVDGICK